MIDTIELQKSMAFWNPLEPESMEKKTFHKEARKFLKKLASSLGMDDFDIRVCAGGPAVSGEVTLQNSKIMVQISADMAYRGLGPVMFRSVTGVCDYVGGTNNWSNVVNAEEKVSRFLNTL